MICPVKIGLDLGAVAKGSALYGVHKHEKGYFAIKDVKELKINTL